MNILITMTADNAEDLEWRECEMRKLLISQDLNIVSCSFREEQGFLSSLPLTNLEKHLYERSKRNVLTSGAASCYPFTAYELSDDNGILLGVNKYNNSLVIVDIFNSAAYKNANIAIMGTSGAGKTFTLQLMALRMRRKGTLHHCSAERARISACLPQYGRRVHSDLSGIEKLHQCHGDTQDRSVGG